MAIWPSYKNEAQSTEAFMLGKIAHSTINAL